jgi:hypothetical protein
VGVGGNEGEREKKSGNCRKSDTLVVADDHPCQIPPPHGNALQRVYETDKDLPLIKHCPDCGVAMYASDSQEAGTCYRCRKRAGETDKGQDQ